MIKKSKAKEEPKKVAVKKAAAKPKARKPVEKAPAKKSLAATRKMQTARDDFSKEKSKIVAKKSMPVKAAAPTKIIPPVIEKPKVVPTPGVGISTPGVGKVTPPKVEPPKPEPEIETYIFDKPAAHTPSANAPAAQTKTAEPAKPKILELEMPIPLKDLASRIGVKPNEIIINLMGKNVFATINQSLGEEAVRNILKDYDIELQQPKKIEDQVATEHRDLEDKQDMTHLVARAPVVTFMGHVDHGKTSLLDYIRKTRVADKEKGGITQHIGAYEVKFKNGSVTFLDTPGHAAFTAMRARGANATDIVVLVVAADDGVMPQTREAIDHARAADVTIVVALNKCDLPSANIEKIKGQLSTIGLNPEDWGGKTITVPVSAKTGDGVDHLLEMLLLEAELLELKANPHLKARGVVIEGKLSSGQGPVATILVKNGTLKLGDMILTGMHYGKIKAMMNHKGERVNEAPPSKPVSVLGLSGVPMSGDEFFVVRDEKKAKTLSMLKQDEARARRLKSSKRVTLEDFYSQLKEGITKKLCILLKGDVQGSVEALKKSLTDLSAKDVAIDIIHADVGNINESDIMLAVASNAVVIGFNVKIDEGAAEIASKEGIEIKMYGIIYEAIQDVVAAMEGLLEPIEKEIFIGRAVIKQVFKVTKAGTIAGSMVVKGKITRTGIAKLIRDKKVVYEGKITSLKRFKDDAREVAEGFECGISLDRHDDIKESDTIEVYTIEKVARRLESRK